MLTSSDAATRVRRSAPEFVVSLEERPLNPLEDREDVMKTTLIGIALVVAMPVTAMAFQCPSLQAQINKEYGKRFDGTASTVRRMAAEADALHKSGKHAESVKKYEEAAAAGKVTLMKK